jgi:hypothetical protein
MTRLDAKQGKPVQVEHFTERDIPSGNPSGHFITKFINSTCAPQSRSWTALLTQSMYILSGGHGGESLTESIDNDQSFESCHTGRMFP